MRLDELTPLNEPGWDDRVRSHLLAQLLPGETPPDADTLAELIEHHRLRVLFPGRYVLFRDLWQDAGAVRVLVKREVFFAPADWSEAQNFLDSLAPEDRDAVELQYVDP